jgi:EthD domain-containing protein
MLKLICFIRRNAALTPEQFHRHWRDVHAELLRNTPSVARHLLRYEQNPRALEDYARGEPDCDGVAIAWYRDRPAMEALFSEPEYLEKIAPDERYLSDAARTQWVLCDEERQVLS